MHRRTDRQRCRHYDTLEVQPAPILPARLSQAHAPMSQPVTAQTFTTFLAPIWLRLHQSNCPKPMRRQRAIRQRRHFQYPLPPLGFDFINPSAETHAPALPPVIAQTFAAPPQPNSCSPRLRDLRKPLHHHAWHQCRIRLQHSTRIQGASPSQIIPPQWLTAAIGAQFLRRRRRTLQPHF